MNHPPPPPASTQAGQPAASSSSHHFGFFKSSKTTKSSPPPQTYTAPKVSTYTGPNTVPPPDASTQLKGVAHEVGGTIITTGATAAKTASELNKQYKITDRLKAAVVETVNTVKEVDEEYKISDKMKQAVVDGYHQAKEVNEKYKITDTISDGAFKIANKIGEGVQKAVPLPSDNPQAPQK